MNEIGYMYEMEPPNPQPSQHSRLGRSHLREVFGGLVEIARQVECAVDHVEQQFIVGRPARFEGVLPRRVDADDDLPFQPRRIVFQREAEHVGRIVVGEELPIELVDRLVIDDGDAHGRLIVRRVSQRPLDRPFNLLNVDRRLGLIRERNLMPTFRRLLVVIGGGFVRGRRSHAEGATAL